jgi:hypothetical protein
MNQCPLVPQVFHCAVLNFVENSRRYSWINVYHWCQRHGDKLISGVNDTGEKFHGLSVVDDTIEQLSLVTTTPVINLLLVIRTRMPWRFIHSRLSLRIFEKIRNDPNGILRGQGDTDLWQKPEVENLFLYFSVKVRRDEPISNQIKSNINFSKSLLHRRQCVAREY